MNDTVDLTAGEIGDPIVVSRGGGTIFGRIVGFDGDAFRGIYPILKVGTPGGSTLTCGRVWCRPPTKDDLLKLEEYEELARNNPKNDWYAGQLPAPEDTT